MKMFKKITTRIITAALLCAVMVLGACSSSESTQSTASTNENKDITYTVTVKDALGAKTASGVVVKFMQGGEQKAMQNCDENGAASKTLPAGEYDVELAFTDSSVQYHYEAARLTAEANSAEVVISKKISGEPTVLSVGADEFDAYNADKGCTYVELEDGKRNYFIFTPTESGNYEFSVIGAKDAVLGYYGAPHFVQGNNVAENVKEDGSFTINVTASMISTEGSGTSHFVLGIDANGASSAVLAINRLGDPLTTIEDEPWEIYQTTAELEPYTLPEGAEMKEFDLTASSDTYKLVYNEADGFYHLGSADGELVLVRVAEDSDYIASFATMLDRSGISRYFYDENGEFEKKVSYSECLLEYIECVDENEGVYPLTEDLKHIIQQRGEYVGWWDIESSGYIFKDINGNNDTTINTEIAWLMMCCYIG